MKTGSVLGLAAAGIVGLGLLAGDAAGGPKSESFKADPVHSTVIFRIKHLGASYTYGRFNDMSGSFTLDSASPAGNTFDLQIAAASVDTNSADRDKHLRGPDFFDAEKFASIRFKGSAARRLGSTSLEVEGRLTLHGVTKPVTVKIDLIGRGKGFKGETRAGFECVFTVKRSDFGMTKLMGPVGDDVRLIVSVEGIRQ
jgi:polyisoprenoid-binding protein YceI